MPLWHYPELNLGFVSIHKNASNSIKDLRLPRRRVDLDEFLTLPNRVAFWRDPTARIVSAWRTVGGRREPFDAFVKRACLAHRGDGHMMSQTEHCLGKNLTEYIFWDFARLAEVLGISAVPHVNSSSGSDPEWSDETKLKFDVAYAKDLATWDSRPKGENHNGPTS
jgi:hypothetical protein